MSKEKKSKKKGKVGVLNTEFEMDENVLTAKEKVRLAWVKVFKINPEFRILRLTFHRKSASKC